MSVVATAVLVALGLSAATNAIAGPSSSTDMFCPVAPATATFVDGQGDQTGRATDVLDAQLTVDPRTCTLSVLVHTHATLRSGWSVTVYLNVDGDRATGGHVLGEELILWADRVSRWDSNRRLFVDEAALMVPTTQQGFQWVVRLNPLWLVNLPRIEFKILSVYYADSPEDGKDDAPSSGSWFMPLTAPPSPTPPSTTTTPVPQPPPAQKPSGPRTVCKSASIKRVPGGDHVGLQRLCVTGTTRHASVKLTATLTTPKGASVRVCWRLYRLNTNLNQRQDTCDYLKVKTGNRITITTRRTFSSQGPVDYSAWIDVTAGSKSASSFYEDSNRISLG